MRARVGEVGPRLRVRGTGESLVAGLFTDDTVLLIKNEGMLQRIVDRFDKLCKTRKMKVNAGKGKAVVCVKGYIQERSLDVIYLTFKM